MPKKKANFTDLQFGSAIDAATMKSMEKGAASNERGQDRRLALLAMNKDKATLVSIAKDEPKAFEAMYDRIESFKKHAQALLDVASSAHLRMVAAGSEAMDKGYIK